MKRYVRDGGFYTDIMMKLRDKFPDTLGHIFIDEIVVMIDTEFRINPPKGKNGDKPDEEALRKWEDKKRKAWKFNIKVIPKLYQDVLDSGKQFVLIVRKDLVDELNEAQIVAHIYSELRKINAEYKLEKPDVNTFSDLVTLIGRSDWDTANDIPNLLEMDTHPMVIAK